MHEHVSDRPLAADHPSSLCTQLLVYKNASYTLELRKKIAAWPQNKVIFIAKGGERGTPKAQKHGKLVEIGWKICPAGPNLLTYPPPDMYSVAIGQFTNLPRRHPGSRVSIRQTTTLVVRGLGRAFLCLSVCLSV